MSTTMADRSRRLATRIGRATGTTSREALGRPASHREHVRRELAAYADRIDLAGLVREHGSPLFVLDPDRVTTQLLALRRELPMARVHFATKSLPLPSPRHPAPASAPNYSRKGH